MGICHLAAVQRTNRENGAILMATGGEQVEPLLQDLKKNTQSRYSGNVVKKAHFLDSTNCLQGNPLSDYMLVFVIVTGFSVNPVNSPEFSFQLAFKYSKEVFGHIFLLFSNMLFIPYTKDIW